MAAASAIPRTRAVRRSLTLLRIFLVASAAILLAGAVLLSWILSGRLKAQVIDDTRSSLTQLRTHRGTQFAPAVVDAFFRVLERSRPPEGSRTRPRTRARVAAST